MRDNDFSTAVADNLGGHTAAQSNGDVPAGIDHGRQVLGLTDKDVALWCTWADQVAPNSTSPPPIAELSALAKQTGGRLLMEENTGNQTDSAALARMAQNVTKYKLRLVMWVRFSNLANSQGVTFAQFKSSAQA